MQRDGTDALSKHTALPPLAPLYLNTTSDNEYHDNSACAPGTVVSTQTQSLPAYNKTLPRIVHWRSDTVDAASFSFSPDEKPIAPYSWRAPRYTAREIVRRSHHPLWAASPMVRLRFLRLLRGPTIPAITQAEEIKTEIKAPYKARTWLSQIPLLLRDECVARESIVAAERSEALRTLPISSWALADAISELCIVEGIRRRVIAEEEEASVRHMDNIRVFLHRCLSVGTEPLVRVMRNYALRWRGRRARQSAARESLQRQEAVSRCDVMAEWIASQRSMLCQVTEAIEALFRCEIGLLQMRVQCVCGAALIRLKERVDLFPMLFGCQMVMARVCGRVSGHTLFRQLDLERQYHYDRILQEDEMKRKSILCLRLFDELERHDEVNERAQYEKAEAIAREELQFTVFALMQERSRREIEIVEACERELDVIPAIQYLMDHFLYPIEVRRVESVRMSCDASMAFAQLDASMHEGTKGEEKREE